MWLDPRYAWMRQLTAFALLLAVWEAAGQAGMLNPMYAPMPSRIGAALADLNRPALVRGDTWPAHTDAGARNADLAALIRVTVCIGLSWSIYVG